MMTAAAPLLFQPITLKGLTARNRVVVAQIITHAPIAGASAMGTSCVLVASLRAERG
jgi:2,4-dienoyl-CoA reductase-like NADH-dependent reductase (Old Yellow Enzyme family)